MVVVKPPSPSRRDRALQTRRRILGAASTEFRANGYLGTTMAAIAAGAGVAVQTVYFVFHTKAELLSRTFDFAVLGDEEPTPPEETAWYRGLATDADARRALRGFVAGTSTILSRASPIAEVVRAAAASDPEVALVHQHHERLRVEGYARAVGTLAGRGMLRAGVDVDEATDVLLTLAGPDTYLAFVRDRNWSHDRYVAWAGDALAELLLAAPGGRRRRTRAGASPSSPQPREVPGRP
jgi:AcrR family transcriptional regulator